MRPIDVVLELASQQHGVVASRQARAAGMTRNQIQAMVRSGRWTRFATGTYLVVGAPATWKQTVSAAVLAVDPSAAASHLTSAYLLGVIERRSARIDVTTRYARQDGSRQGPALVHRARTLGEEDICVVDGIRVMCAARTMIDISGLLPVRQLAAACDRGLLAGTFTADDIRRYASERRLRHLRGVGRLFEILRDRDEGVPESELEREFLDIGREFGLPAPIRQETVGPYRVDFFYPDAALVVEVDGRSVHGTADAFFEDRTRDTDLVVGGLKVVRFAWRHVKYERSYVADSVLAILRRAGLASA